MRRIRELYLKRKTTFDISASTGMLILSSILRNFLAKGPPWLQIWLSPAMVQSNNNSTREMTSDMYQWREKNGEKRKRKKRRICCQLYSKLLSAWQVWVAGNNSTPCQNKMFKGKKKKNKKSLPHKQAKKSPPDVPDLMQPMHWFVVLSFWIAKQQEK